MLSGLAIIIEAMADQVRNVFEDADQEVQVEPRYVLYPTPLTVDLFPGEQGRDDGSAGFADLAGGYFITARARINTPDFDASYDTLIAMMDDTSEISLMAALVDDPTLNGYASSVHPVFQSGLLPFQHPSGEGAFIGFQVDVLVLPAIS